MPTPDIAPVSGKLMIHRHLRLSEGRPLAGRPLGTALIWDIVLPFWACRANGTRESRGPSGCPSRVNAVNRPAADSSDQQRLVTSAPEGGVKEGVPHVHPWTLAEGQTVHGPEYGRDTAKIHALPLQSRGSGVKEADRGTLAAQTQCEPRPSVERHTAES